MGWQITIFKGCSGISFWRMQKAPEDRFLPVSVAEDIADLLMMPFLSILGVVGTTRNILPMESVGLILSSLFITGTERER